MAFRISSPRLVFGATALLALGLLVGAPAPAKADHGGRDSRRGGYSRRSDSDQCDSGRGSSSYRRRSRSADYYGSGYSDYGDGYSDYSDYGDGYSGRRYGSSNRVGYGPHDRYGDLDGDGIPNYRDPHPDRWDSNRDLSQGNWGRSRSRSRWDR
jgi:hypothetical protein